MKTPFLLFCTCLLAHAHATIGLEIHVTNTWNNRLVADASLPAAKRQSYISEGNLFTPKDPLLTSGLIGPVRLIKPHQSR